MKVVDMSDEVSKSVELREGEVSPRSVALRLIHGDKKWIHMGVGAMYEPRGRAGLIREFIAAGYLVVMYCQGTNEYAAGVKDEIMMHVPQEKATWLQFYCGGVSQDEFKQQYDAQMKRTLDGDIPWSAPAGTKRGADVSDLS